MTDTLEATTKAQGNASDRAPKLSVEIPETTLTNIEIEDRLIKARIEMLISAPFFGNLATRLRFKDATEWCPTAATDGKYFYYNRNFVFKQNISGNFFIYNFFKKSFRHSL